MLIWNFSKLILIRKRADVLYACELSHIQYQLMHMTISTSRRFLNHSGYFCIVTCCLVLFVTFASLQYPNLPTIRSRLIRGQDDQFVLEDKSPSQVEGTLTGSPESSVAVMLTPQTSPVIMVASCSVGNFEEEYNGKVEAMLTPATCLLRHRHLPQLGLGNYMTIFASMNGKNKKLCFSNIVYLTHLI